MVVCVTQCFNHEHFGAPWRNVRLVYVVTFHRLSDRQPWKPVQGLHYASKSVVVSNTCNSETAKEGISRSLYDYHSTTVSHTISSALKLMSYWNTDLILCGWILFCFEVLCIYHPGSECYHDLSPRKWLPRTERFPSSSVMVSSYQTPVTLLSWRCRNTIRTGHPRDFFLKQDNIEASSWALFLDHETKLL